MEITDTRKIGITTLSLCIIASIIMLGSGFYQFATNGKNAEDKNKTSYSLEDMQQSDFSSGTQVFGLAGYVWDVFDDATDKENPNRYLMSTGVDDMYFIAVKVLPEDYYGMDTQIEITQEYIEKDKHPMDMSHHFIEGILRPMPENVLAQFNEWLNPKGINDEAAEEYIVKYVIEPYDESNGGTGTAFIVLAFLTFFVGIIVFITCAATAKRGGYSDENDNFLQPVQKHKLYGQDLNRGMRDSTALLQNRDKASIVYGSGKYGQSLSPELRDDLEPPMGFEN